MKKSAILVLILILATFSYSQYADLGTGALKDKIWWFNWSDFTVADNAERTFVTDDGLTVTITFSNVTMQTPVPSVMNTWPGAILHLLYNFSDPSIQPALHSLTSTVSSKFSMTITAARNNVQVPFTLVTADAEASYPIEITTLTTNGSNWSTIDFFRNSSQSSNPLTGCNTQTVKITDTYGGTTQNGQNPVLSTSSQAGAPLLLDIFMEKLGNAGMALAFGILAPLDRGDLPATYGFAQHQVIYNSTNNCNYNPPYPFLSQNENLKIGAIAGDADGIQTNDDGFDEDGFTNYSYFNQSGTYTVTLPITNTTGNSAYLTGWIDYDQSGTFDPTESVSVTVPNNSTSAVLHWTGLPTIMPFDGNFAFRFRLSSNSAETQNITGLARDGEVEDYLIPASQISEPPNTSPIGNIINDYTPVISLDPCINLLQVSNASTFNIGDTVLLIQMKGAVIDSSNTATFGTISNYNNAGNYEFNFIASKTGNTLQLKNRLLKKYDVSFGKVQLIRVPYYENAKVSTELTCLPWDGTVGGVLVFNVKDDLVLNTNINVNYNGFRRKYPLNSNQVTCNETLYYYDASTNQGAEKGEGIHFISDGKNYGRGAPSNAGGGGNGHNAGGGGGGNGGAGGNGGDQWESCDNIAEHIGGRGGKSLTNSATLNKIYMGGSGGMGQGNDQSEFPSGSGGGIIIISANSIKSNGHLISAIGENASPCPGGGCGDGMSGGGAGGTILLNIPTLKDPVSIKLNGGDGADHVSANNFKHGPGGGGGGGVLAVTQPSVSPLYNFDISGGKNGINTSHGNDPHGATPGTEGISINSFPIALSSTIFEANIDSVTVDENMIRCNNFEFNGMGYVNNSPIISWKWSFGDNANSTSQNSQHTYTAGGLYTVKLIATDGYGCSDSASIQVNAKIPPIITKTNDTTICFNRPLQLNATGGTLYTWSPANGLDDPNSPNPTATISQNTRYKVIVRDQDNCFSEDSVSVTLLPYPQFAASSDKTICQGTEVKLTASGGDNYLWTPVSSISDPFIDQPTTIPSTTTDYSVYINENTCGFDTTINMRIIVNPTPTILAQKTNDINCNTPTAQLNASGALKYTWSGSEGLNNPSISNPEASLDSTTTFIVTGTNQFGCASSAEVTVNVTKTGIPRFVVPNAFTPNNDGKNDCFGIRRWGNAQIAQFAIYNRWGQIVFQTKDPSHCWDGTFNGRQQDAGGYIYVIKATTICGAVFKKGIVTLVR